MSKCPFCGGKVQESLLIHGGTCPHCFGIIPGEESATDPGEVVKARLREEDEAVVRQRSRRQLLMLAPVFAALIGVAGYALMPGPEVEELKMDDFAIELDVAAFAPQVASAKEASGANGKGAGKGVNQGAAKTEDARGGTASPAAAGGPPLPAVGAPAGSGVDRPGGIGDAASRLAEASQAAGGVGGVRSGAPGVGGVGSPGGTPLAPTASDGGSASLAGPVIAVDRGRPLLTDDADIKAAVRDMINGNRGQLQFCYEQALKADEGFGGAWTVAFTITKEGTMSGVGVRANKTPNAGFEGCIKQRVQAWRLAARLEKERSLSIPLGFSSDG